MVTRVNRAKQAIFMQGVYNVLNTAAFIDDTSTVRLFLWSYIFDHDKIHCLHFLGDSTSLLYFIVLKITTQQCKPLTSVLKLWLTIAEKLKYIIFILFLLK